MDPHSTKHVRAVRLHKSGDLPAAAALYREALAEHRSPHTAVLLAGLLLTSPAEPDASSAREASELTNFAGHVAKTASPADAALLSRVGYCMLLLSGNLGTQHKGTASAERVSQAIELLERAVAVDAGLVVAWRNLATAYKFAGRLEDAEAALRCAVAAGSGKASSSLLYSHAKALRRLKRFPEAAAVFCDALDAECSHELAKFWLQVTYLACGTGLPAIVRSRIEQHLSAGHNNCVIPTDYVRKLFDGYAAKFESHLTESLDYRTPSALYALAVAASGDVGVAQWEHCADLGCGTGLMGPLFRDRVRGSLCGVDLSPAMIAEARRCRADTYSELVVGDVVDWLSERALRITAGAAPLLDLLLCADVLVYITDLEPLLRAAHACMASPPNSVHCEASSGRAAEATRPLFVCSTEADLEPAGSHGFRLLLTGRCCHSREYVLRQAAAAGFRLLKDERRPIRKNGGTDIIGDLFVFTLDTSPC
jgi:predicted TPR repeat methyltransferase